MGVKVFVVSGRVGGARRRPRRSKVRGEEGRGQGEAMGRVGAEGGEERGGMDEERGEAGVGREVRGELGRREPGMRREGRELGLGGEAEEGDERERRD